MSQERFRTSREVYNHIRWDPRLDAREFFIGYDAHGEALEEMPFEAFVPDGEIPWHRVWYFKHGRRVVWDRKERLDLLDSVVTTATKAPPVPAAPVATAPAVSPAPEKPRTGGFTPLPAYRHDANAAAWVEAPPHAERTGAPERLTFATLNVLFDLYDAERLATERRVPATLALLRGMDADVIALQEVTPPFLRALLAEPWVRERYHVSDGPDATTVTPYGQVLLSRIPFASLSQRVFTRDKRVIAGGLAMEGGTLWVAAPHLTSNRDPSGAGARAAQAQALIDWAGSLPKEAPGRPPDVVLVGDFNFGDGEPEAEAFAAAGFVDIWPALRPTESGETFDPVRNALAALTTTSGLRRRLDRVWVSSPSGRLVPEAVDLFGEAPLEGPPAPSGAALFASDHFGLRCVLRVGAASRPEAPRPPARSPKTSLVHHTAVVLIPPESVWAPIQDLRARHDSKFRRWMPHVTLLYPFVPEEHFDEAEAALTEALREVKPFEVTLAGFSSFEHRANVTVWLRPEDQPHGALKALHKVLEAALPQCNEQGRKSAKGFTPHLSVGQLPRAGAAATSRTLATWEKDWRPLTFQAREVCLIRRKGDTPFEVVRRVPFGGEGGRDDRRRGHAAARAARDDARTQALLVAPGDRNDSLLQTLLASRGARATPEARRIRETAVEWLQGVCGQLGTELHPYGSYLLETDDRDSDVDAVAVGPSRLSREGFAHALIQELTTRAPYPVSARFVADAAIPLVKLSLGGVKFDVSYASRPEGVAPCPPEALLAHHGEKLDSAGFRAVLGLVDTRALLDCVAREGADPERFRGLLRAVKTWAKARGLYSHALGYLGGLSWAVMAAWVSTRAPGAVTDPDSARLARLFETFAAWPWPQPVALTPETARYRPDGKRDLMPVIAPAAPPRNTARNVSRSTFRVLGEELTRAHQLAQRALREGTASAWQALFEPLERELTDSLQLQLSIDAPSTEAREVAAGWVLGHMTELVYRLEGDRRLFARPLPSSGPGGPFWIALSTRKGNDFDALHQGPDAPMRRVVPEFIASFQQWSHRPEGASLRVDLVHTG